MKKTLLSLAIICLSVANTPQASANSGATGERLIAQLQGILSDVGQTQAGTAVPQQGTVEVAFSPNRGALQLVLKAINSATRTIDMMAYAFTSAEVTRALLNARKRGVTVRLVVDHDQNLSAKNKNTKSVAALAALVNSGATVRSVSTYLLMHDKCAILDSSHVQTGSFNYTQAAATRNSENVLVNWHAPALAAAYGKHFEEVWSAGQPFNGR